jgi:hypothetical protein
MATSLNTPLTGEIWHLSIEDLLQPLQEAPRLGGPGPFVINLSASSAPIASPAKQLAEFTATAHVYQIQRTEDRRPRYRLRLGPFLTEDEADAVLAKVREIYPSALTATAESDDLRAISSLQTKAEALATGRHAKRPAAPSSTAASAPTLRAVPAGTAAAPSSGAPATANAPASAGAPVAANAPASAPAAVSVPRVATSAPNNHKPQPVTSQPSVLKAPVAPAAVGAPAGEFRATPAPPAQPAAPPTAGAAPQAAVASTHGAAQDIHTQSAARPQPVAAAPARTVAPAPAPQPTPSRAQATPASPTVMAAPPPAMGAPPVTSAPPPAPAPKAAASPPVSAAPAMGRSLPQPLAIPVLSDTVSLVRRPPVRATARRAVPPKAHTPKPIPVITHKVIPTITHKLVPTITEEVEFAPAPIPIAAVKAEPATPASAGPVIKPAPAVDTPAPTAVKAAPTSHGASPINAVASRPAAAKPTAPDVKPAAPGVKPAAPGVKPACAAPAAIKPMPRQPMPAPLKALLPPSARRVEALNEPLPNLESTQTLRPLTQLELEDDTVSRWFVIQLSLAEESFDPDSLPNLDIFGEYRLYSVAGIDQGKVMHALRLGFFAEEGAAAAVASYLSAFYEKPTIKRISTAERDRFSDQRVEARMDVGATGRHAVIEITSERVVREKRTTATVMPMPVRPAGVAGGGAAR